MKSLYRVLAIALIPLAVTACSSAPEVDPEEAPPAEMPAFDEEEQEETVHLRILGFNDIHGALEGPNGEVTVDGEEVEAGGVHYLGAHLEKLRGEADHTTVVHAGDLIGASPLTSALFHDEPTIEAMNKAGLDIAGVGNHEFDQGVDEFLRIVEGGCHAEEGCREGYEYEGAEFSYLAANVRWRDSGMSILPPYKVRQYGDVTVGYIGMTLEDTPSVVVPSAIEDVTFHSEAKVVEEYLPELQAKGVDTIVVVVHEGAVPHGESGEIDDCDDVRGPIVSVTEEMPEEVEVIVSGHTHSAYICEFDDRLVTQAGHSGRIISVIDLEFDAATGALVEHSAHQHPVTDDIEPHPEIAELLDKYVALAEERAGRVVGMITDDLPRGPRTAAGESPIGRLIADAQLAATKEEADAQIAFMNPGGIRDQLRYDDESDEPGSVTYAQLHTIQPFANVLITMTLNGEQIHKVLERQWRDGDQRPHVLAVSSGFRYEYDPEAPLGERVEPDSITLDGETIDPDEEYRVTVNNFLADGGDGFTVLEEGSDRVTGIVDLDALADYIEAHAPIDPPTDVRATELE